MPWSYPRGQIWPGTDTVPGRSTTSSRDGRSMADDRPVALLDVCEECERGGGIRRDDLISVAVRIDDAFAPRTRGIHRLLGVDLGPDISSRILVELAGDTLRIEQGPGVLQAGVDEGG